MTTRLVLLLFLLSCRYSNAVGPEHVNLQQARVSEAYRNSLDKSYCMLRGWCVIQNRKLPEHCLEDVEGINKLLVDHIQFLYEEKRGVSAARHVVLAVQTKFRALKPFLGEAWDSVKSWEQIAPVCLRTPVPPLVLEAMFSFAMLLGFATKCEKTAREWISFGVGLRVCFDALLRPGEWAQLVASKVAVPSDRLHGLVRCGLCTVLNGKNRRVFGRIQVAIVDDQVALSWLSWLVKGMRGDSRLFHGGPGKFRSLFRKVVVALGLESPKITPAGLRAGGATHKFVTNALDIGRLKYRGRWASLNTLEHYLQEASAQLAMLQLEDSVLTRLSGICDRAVVFQAPPGQPWQSFFSRPSRRVPWTARGSTRRSARRSGL